MEIDIRIIFALIDLFRDIKKTINSFKRKPQKRKFHQQFNPRRRRFRN